jgi:hypothetical protein
MATPKEQITITTADGLDLALRDSWQELEELCTDLPSDDLFDDDDEPEAESVDFFEGEAWWRRAPVEEGEEGILGDVDPGERYVYSRTVAALSARINKYVEERDLNKVQDLWSQLCDHAMQAPGTVPTALTSRVTELLDEISDLTPVLIYEPPRVVEPPKIELELSQELVDQIVRHPELLREISPRRFEEFIKEIFGAFGYLVELTARTRDGGRDIIAVRSEHSIMVKYLIECKRYSPERRVGVSYVRQLYGVKIDEGATKAILATTSYFSQPARELERRHLWELELKDYDAVVDWAKSYWNLLRKIKAG